MMVRMGLNDFLNSDPGRLARFQSRKRRRVCISIPDIEPQSKKMPESERIRFQTEIANQLSNARRSTFNGDIALKLQLATTSKNAPQAHTIAKNLLDLLGRRIDAVKWSRRHLLYKDDSQIQGLSVSCRHGNSDPNISLEARPFAEMLDDLELANEAIQQLEMESRARYESERESEWIDSFRSALHDDVKMRATVGDSLYEAYLKMTRFYAQRALLASSRIQLPILSWMYGRPRIASHLTGNEIWAQMTTESSIRLQVGSLPVASGGSTAFKESIRTEISAFKKRWDWLISPLVVPVGLEVIVRPSPKTPSGVLHDLDNIVRDYLIPEIVPSFGTVSDHRWTIDFEQLKQRDSKLSETWGPMPPAGTRVGVTRYEAWRLPAIDGQPGFVSVALVADLDAACDVMEMADRKIDEWSESLTRKSRW